MLERILGPVLVPRRYSRLLILGCCLGVAAILVVLSLFANYYRAVELQLLGIHPHLSVRPMEAGDTLTLAQRWRLAEAAAQLDGVIVARPAIDRVVRLRLASAESFPVVCQGFGGGAVCVDPATQVVGGDGAAAEMRAEVSGAEVSGVEVRGATGFHLRRSRSLRVRLRGLDVVGGTATVELGRVLDVKGEGLDLGRMAQGPEHGMSMAGYFERRLFSGASSLDDFVLAEPAGEGGTRPALHHFRLLSTLQLGLRQAATPVLVTSLASAGRLLGGTADPDVFEIRLRDAERASEAASILERHLAPTGDLLVHTWLDQDEGALRLLGVLRWVLFVAASSVMGVAALGVVSTLSLVVMEGRRKIAMLRAMGLRDRNLHFALAFEGLRIATWGLAGGVGLGVSASWALLRLPGFRQGLQKMGVLDPRVMLPLSDVIQVAVATWILFLVVAWWPAREACRIHPVTGLQS